MALLDLLVERVQTLESWQLWLPIPLSIFALIWFRVSSSPAQDGKTPPSIPESFPGKHAYQYIFHNMDFLDYIKKNFSTQNILTFNMGPKGIYLINSSANANAVVRSSGHMSSEALIFMALKQLDGVCASDLAKYKQDNSHRTQMSGSDVPELQRVWAPMHRLFNDHLASKTGVATLQSKFGELFGATLKTRGNGQWEEVRLYEFLQEEMANAALVAFGGEELLKVNEGFVKAMWNYDNYVYPLVLSVPRFLYPRAYRARDQFHELGEKWLESVNARYDWESDADPDWEPLFGSRYFRLQSKFLTDRKFETRSQVGMMLAGLWASNANSIPMSGWLLIHVIQDKALFAAVRAAALTVFTTHPTTGEKTLDVKALGEIPLMQSLYAETLRLHVSINITREVKENMKLDGYALKKGYLVQTPSHIAHFDEGVWNPDGKDHPVTEFWAERHLKYVEEFDVETGLTTVPVFSMEGRAGGYFPYGGGSSLCPGRHFAKLEMLTALAMIVVEFDIELVEYVNMDGTKSERGPVDNKWYCGTAAMPPDRDLKIRWKRV